MSDIAVIFKIWDRQYSGYVSLPRKKDGEWQEKNFKYPEDKQKIIQWIKDSISNKYNIYWCPTVITNPRRTTNNIPQINILYADLDEVNPENIPQDLKPSVAWQSSKGRYAAIWFLNDYIPAQSGEKLNKKLTYYLDADKGGWDLTQVLRIPGLPNFKYNPPSPGKLLWYEDKVYTTQTFKSLPEVEDTNNDIPQDVDTVDEDVNGIIYKYIDKLHKKAVKLLLTPEDEVAFSDRSETLWELECLLFEAGMTVDEVYTVVKNSIWNKYRGRKDEEKRLKSEVIKASNHTEPVITTGKRKRVVTTYADLMAKQLDQPKWLIKDWWEAGSHGIIAGEPKTYKSTTSTEIAISVASGKPLFNKFEVVQPGPVVIIQEENSEWLMKDRFAKIANSKDLMGEVNYKDNKILIRAPEDLPIYMLNRQGFNLTSDEDREWIWNFTKQIKPVLIIFDPIYLMLGNVDSNSAKELSGVLQWLIDLSTEYNTAVMLVHHFNKNGTSSRGGQRMLGSVTFHAWVQSAIYSRVSETQKNTIIVEREFRSFKTPDNVEIRYNLGEPGDEFYDVEVMETGVALQNVIQVLLQNSPYTLKDLVGQTGYPTHEVKAVLNMMIKQGIIIKEDNKFMIA